MENKQIPESSMRELTNEELDQVSGGAVILQIGGLTISNPPLKIVSKPSLQVVLDNLLHLQNLKP